MQPCLLLCDTLKFLECKDIADLPCIYCWSKFVSMKRPVIGHRSRYVCVSNFKNHYSDFRIFYLFPFFRVRYPAILWRVGFYSPSKHASIITLSLIFLEKWALLTLGHMSIILLFLCLFSERGGSSDP
jgi:hypothetical protein